MKNKKILFIIIPIIIIVAIATIMIIKNKKERSTTFEEDKATSEVKLQDIEFKNITKEFNSGITTIRAEAYNNTKEEKSINVKIVLKDDAGKELTNMIQVIEKIPSKGKKILQTGIVGNYSNVKNIEFKVLTDEEIEEYNR